MNDKAKCKNELDKIIKINNNFSPAKVDLAVIMISEEKYKLALELLESAESNAPGNSKIMFFKAVVFEKLQDKSAAIKILNELIESNTKDQYTERAVQYLDELA